MKPCCATWKHRVEDLKEEDRKVLDQLVEEKGVPKYTLAVAYEEIETRGNYCTSCGTPLKDGLVAHEEPVQVIKKPRQAPPPPTSNPVLREEKTLQTMCPICKGTGYMSGVKGEGAKCMKCVGKGFFGRANTGRPVTQEHLDNAAALTAKIEKEKKPLREDAKPENWDKIK